MRLIRKRVNLKQPKRKRRSKSKIVKPKNSKRKPVRLLRSKVKKRKICQQLRAFKGDFVGSGAFGEVFQFKNRVVKLIYAKARMFTDTELDELKKEVRLAKEIGRKGIGPKVDRSGVCMLNGRQTGYIIMQKLKATSDVKERILCSPKMQEQLFVAFYKLSKLNIGNYDFNIHNIMYKNKKFYLIDMGLAQKMDHFDDAFETNMITLINLCKSISGKGMQAEDGWTCDDLDPIVEEIFANAKHIDAVMHVLNSASFQLLISDDLKRRINHYYRILLMS